jgi:hypothetical protein
MEAAWRNAVKHLVVSLMQQQEKDAIPVLSIKMVLSVHVLDG